MRHKVITLAAAAAMLLATIAVSGRAEARGGRIAAGVIGGLAAGAIVGGALASPYYYGPGPYYYGPGPGPYPACYWRRVWTPYGPARERVCY